MINGIVYSYKSPSNKYYIGRTIHENKRKYTHKWYAENGDSKNVHAFQKALKKYGFENFEYSVLFEYSAENKDEVLKHINEKEIYYIAKYKEEGKTLYNCSLGGDGGSPMLGKHFSEEAKKKMREAHLGQIPSEETIRKRKLALKGKRHLTKEEINKLTEGRKKRLKKICQLDLNGNLIKVWKSCPSVTIVSYSALKQCLNGYPRKDGKPRTCGGYRWVYLDDYHNSKKLIAYSKA